MRQSAHYHRQTKDPDSHSGTRTKQVNFKLEEDVIQALHVIKSEGKAATGHAFGYGSAIKTLLLNSPWWDEYRKTARDAAKRYESTHN